MKQHFTISVEVDADALTSADTVDHELTRLAGALSLFASEYLIELSGAAEGTWHGRWTPPAVDEEDSW